MSRLALLAIAALLLLAVWPVEAEPLPVVPPVVVALTPTNEAEVIVLVADGGVVQYGAFGLDDEALEAELVRMAKDESAAVLAALENSRGKIWLTRGLGFDRGVTVYRFE